MILNRNERLLTQAHPHRQDERMQGQMICPAQQLPEARGSQKKAYEAIHRLPLRGDHLGLFPQCMRDSPDSPRNSLAKFTCGLTAEFTCEITGQPTRHATSGAAGHLRKWGKLSQKTEDYHILIKRSHSTSSGSAQPTRQRDAALACNSQAPLGSDCECLVGSRHGAVWYSLCRERKLPKWHPA